MALRWFRSRCDVFRLSMLGGVEQRLVIQPGRAQHCWWANGAFLDPSVVEGLSGQGQKNPELEGRFVFAEQRGACHGAI